MSTSPKIYIFKVYADGREFKDDPIGKTIGHTISQTLYDDDTESQNVVIVEENEGTNATLTQNSKDSKFNYSKISKTQNSKFGENQNSKMYKTQNGEIANKSQFSNNPTANGYDSSKSSSSYSSSSTPSIAKEEMKNISSKFQTASLSNQMETINNAGDISKYINTLMDEDNSKQSSVIRDKIKVFQSKIEKKEVNKSETVRKNNANKGLIKKDFVEIQEYKDLLSNRDRDPVLNNDREILLNKNKDLSLSNNEPVMKTNKTSTLPRGSKNIYKFSAVSSEPTYWNQRDGLNFTSIEEAKKELIGATKKKPSSDIYKTLNANFVNKTGYLLKKSTGVNSVDHNKASEVRPSTNMPTTSKSKRSIEIPDVQIIARNDLINQETPFPSSQTQPKSNQKPHSQIDNKETITNDINYQLNYTSQVDEDIKPLNNVDKPSVQSLINGYNTSKLETAPQRSGWKARPKSTIIQSSIMSFNDKSYPQTASANHTELLNGSKENNRVDLTSENKSMEKQRRKSLNVNIEIVPYRAQGDNIGTTPIQATDQSKEMIHKDKRSDQHQKPRRKTVTGNVNALRVKSEEIKISSNNEIFIPQPPPPPPPSDSQPLSRLKSPSFISNLRTMEAMDNAPKYVPKKSYTPQNNTELKNTLKKELERKFKSINMDEGEVVEGTTHNHSRDSSIEYQNKSSYTPSKPLRPAKTNTSSSEYEISFEYKMKDYITKDKLNVQSFQPAVNNDDHASQFAESLNKLRKDKALDKIVGRAATGPIKVKKHEAPFQEDEDSNPLTSYAYHIGAKTKEERQFEEGWISVSEAVNETKSFKGRKTEKTDEPPVDYDMTFEENNDSYENQNKENKRLIQNSRRNSTASRSNNVSSSSVAMSSGEYKPPGFNLQSGMVNGVEKQESVKRGLENSVKNNGLVHNEPRPDYD